MKTEKSLRATWRDFRATSSLGATLAIFAAGFLIAILLGLGKIVWSILWPFLSTAGFVLIVNYILKLGFGIPIISNLHLCAIAGAVVVVREAFRSLVGR